MKKIITIGEIVVEIMAVETGNGFKLRHSIDRPVCFRRAGDLHRSGRQARPALRHRQRGRQ
jgi:hypothetical protein